MINYFSLTLIFGPLKDLSFNMRVHNFAGVNCEKHVTIFNAVFVFGNAIFYVFMLPKAVNLRENTELELRWTVIYCNICRKI